jgi:hypothetical protein
VCATQSLGALGYLLAATRLNCLYESQDWRVDQLQGYVATPGAAAEAVEALERMLRSYQIDPLWSSNQVQTARAAQIIAGGR